MLTQPGPDGKTDWTTLTLNVALHSKERPRSNKNGIVYTPTGYKKWMASAVAAFREQWKRDPLEFAIYVMELHGAAKGDVDNIEGAVLDAAVKAGVLRNDTCRILPMHATIWQRSAVPQVVMYVREWWPQK